MKTKKEKEQVKKIYNNRETLELKEFMLLNVQEQSKKIEEILNYMYEDTLKIIPKYIEKVLNLCFEVTDKDIYLPYNLKIAKTGSKVVFDFVERSNVPLFLLFLFTFLFAGIAATYTGVHYLNSLKVNIDLDGDGVADLNIDLDGDGICDINCDEDGDNKPDKNIDYQGNRQSTFNRLQEDGTVKNPMNQDNNGDGKCDLNCDTNDDGWPDTNIDIDGDGKADTNIDTNGDGTPDLNLDNNGDGVCDVNCDNNGDGRCDYNCATVDKENKRELNVDNDGDGICDVNCDTDGDGIPDTNIDHDGNRKPTFNKDDGRGNLSNRTNQDTDGDGRCDLNCDTDGDGWPDTNLDIDGDGKPDLNIDTNDDGYPDLNIDVDADEKCDINCDDNNDGICDRYCTEIVKPSGGDGSVDESGNGTTGVGSASLVVVFEKQNEVVSENIYPDDQPGIESSIPDLKFSIENPTDVEMYYDIRWIITTNNFTTNNFWYRITGDNGGFTQEWQTAPKNDALIKSRVTIAPHTKQNYSVSLTLHGTNGPQNEDQGKAFNGHIKIELVN